MAVVLTRNLTGSAGDPGREIASRLASGRGDSFFYVAPTRRKVRELQREFLSGCPSGAAGPFHLFTLESLAGAVCDLLVPPKRLLSPHLQAAIVQEAIRARASDLRYFTLRGPARRLPRGTLARITNVINRLKESGVYLSSLMQEIGEGDESEQLKLRDIAAIYETYERLLEERYTDPPGLFREANLAWTRPGSAEAFRARYPRVDLLAVTGFDEFSDPELTLLNYLSDVPGLASVVTFDYHPDNDNLFGHLRENYVKFQAMGFRKADAPPDPLPTFHAHIARALFSGEEGRIGAFDATAAVTVCRAADRVREAELIARIIRTNIADTPGLGPGDICVCAPRPELYAALFREVFDQAGIPSNVTDRFRLDESIVVSGVVSMMLISQNNYRIEDILRAGTNPFLTVTPRGGNIDASNLLRMASGLRTVSGRKRWFERIESRLRFLGRTSAGADGGAGGTASPRERAEIAGLRRAQEDLLALDRHIAGFRLPMTPVEFRDAVVRLVEGLGVAKRMAEGAAAGAGDADAEREARACAEFLRFIDEVPELLSRESSPAAAHPISWYLERVRPLLSQVRYNVRQRYGEGVLVTSIDETRGLSFRVLILAGLVDGEFPAVYEPEVFLTPKGRGKRERYHLHEQRYLFYQALSGFRDRLYLTRPLKEDDIDLNPSGFLEWLEAAAAVSRLDPGEGDAYARVLVTPDEVLAGRVREGKDSAADSRDDLLAHVRAAIATESARRRDAGSDAFRGWLPEGALSPSASTRLAGFRHGTYSATQLETYGDCPFRFFAGRVLRLRTTGEPEEGITPRELGRILHEILFEFYTDRRSRGLPPVPGLDDRQFGAALDELMTTAMRRLDEADADDIFWDITRETVLGSPGRPGTLEAMLRAERESGVTAVPSYFEVRFGRTGDDPAHSDPLMYREATVPAGGIFLQGKIDRIDVAGDDFSVVDYKTGAGLPSKKEIEEGASLQLPLYLHCAEAVLSERTGRPMTGGAGLYYHLRPDFEAVPRIGNNTMKGTLLDPRRRFKLADDAAALREQIRGAVARADAYAGRIALGEFPVEPRNPAKICRSCDFRRMCRIRTRMAPGPDEAAGGGHDEAEDHKQNG